MRSERPTGHDLRFGRLPGTDGFSPLSSPGRAVDSARSPRAEHEFLPGSQIPSVESPANQRVGGGRRWNPLSSATPTTMDIDPAFRKLPPGAAVAAAAPCRRALPVASYQTCYKARFQSYHTPARNPPTRFLLCLESSATLLLHALVRG